MRAVLDVGTNSVRLLLAKVSPGMLKPLRRETKVTRLGQGVDAAGRLNEAGIARTLDALADLAALIPRGVPTSILATSAVRDAQNGQDFARLVQERIGFPLEVLSGAQEAQLSFAGAVFSLQEVALGDPVSVVDIGGGSTEIYTGSPSGGLLGGGSAQVGAVRMLERFITTHPLIASEQLVMEQEIEELIKPLVQENLRFEPRDLIAVGGTATSLAAMMQNLAEYDDDKVSGTAFSLAQLKDIYGQLGRLSLKERSQIPSLQAGREDVIVCGAAVLVKVTELMGVARFYTSVGDLLYGKLVEPLGRY